MSYLTIDDLVNISEEYDIRYSLALTCKGKIKYDTKEILINPNYKEDAQTLCHEVTHHYFDKIIGVNMMEEIVEQEGLKLYEEDPKFIEEYTRIKLFPYEIQKTDGYD